MDDWCRLGETLTGRNGDWKERQTVVGRSGRERAVRERAVGGGESWRKEL